MLLCLVNKKGVCFSYLSFPSFLFLPPPLQEARAKCWALGGSSGGIKGGGSPESSMAFSWIRLCFFFVCVSYDWEHIGQGRALLGSLSLGSPQLLPLLRTAAGAWPPRERSRCEMTLHCPQQGVTCMPPAVPSVPLRTPKHAHRYCTRPPRTNSDPLILPEDQYQLHTVFCSNNMRLCVRRIMGLYLFHCMHCCMFPYSDECTCARV